MGYLYIFGTIFFTVYGQLAIKYGVSAKGDMPAGVVEKAYYFVHLFMNPFIFTGFLAAFVASLFWMAAMTKFELSYAYPFMSFSFVLVFILSVFLFNESITAMKIIGLSLIVLGIVVTSRSMT